MRVFASCTNFRKPGECCIANPPKKSKRSRVAEAEGNTKEQGKRRHTTENTARPLAATKIERRSMTVSGMMFLAKLIRRTVMERFLTRHRDRITGSITGFDRILFRGSLRSICYGEGMDIFLSSQQVVDVALGVVQVRRDAQGSLAQADDDVGLAQLLVKSGRLLRRSRGDAGIRTARRWVAGARQHTAVEWQPGNHLADQPAVMLPNGFRSHPQQEFQRSVHCRQVEKAGRLR